MTENVRNPARSQHSGLVQSAKRSFAHTQQQKQNERLPFSSLLVTKGVQQLKPGTAVCCQMSGADLHMDDADPVTAASAKVQSNQAVHSGFQE